MSVTFQYDPQGDGVITCNTNINEAMGTLYHKTIYSDPIDFKQDLRGTSISNPLEISTKTAKEILDPFIKTDPDLIGSLSYEITEYGIAGCSKEITCLTSSDPNSSTVIRAYLNTEATPGTDYAGTWEFTHSVWAYMRDVCPVDTREHIPVDSEGNKCQYDDITYTLTQLYPIQDYTHTGVSAFWHDTKRAGQRVGHGKIQVNTDVYQECPDITWIAYTSGHWEADLIGQMIARGHNPTEGVDYHYGLQKVANEIYTDPETEESTLVASHPSVGANWKADPSQRIVDIDDEIITTTVDTIIINTQLSAHLRPWSATSDWVDNASVNDKKPLLNSFDGKQDLVVPINIEIPDNVSEVTFSVETNPAGIVQHKFSNGLPITDSYCDWVVFSCNDIVQHSVTRRWQGTKTVSKTPDVLSGTEIFSKQASIINPKFDPLARDGVHDFNLSVTSGNPNVLLWLSDPNIDWDADSYNLDIQLSAQIINPAQVGWHPTVHNGYYYLNQIEHFLYAKQDVQGEEVVLEEPIELSVSYLVKANIEQRHEAGEVVFVDTDKVQFIQGNFAAPADPDEYVSTAITDTGDVILASPDGNMLEQGCYVSSVKEFPIEVASWGVISWQSTPASEGSLDVFVRSGSDNVNWSSWVQAINGETIPCENNQRYLQYKVEFRRGKHTDYYPLHIKEENYASFKDCHASTNNIQLLSNGFQMQESDLANGIYVSKDFDLGPLVASLDSAGLSVVMPPAGGSVVLEIATSANKTDWSSWFPVDSSGHTAAPANRYLRYRVTVLPGTETIQIWDNASYGWSEVVVNKSPVITSVNIETTIYEEYWQSPTLHQVRLSGNTLESISSKDILLPMTATIPMDGETYQITDSSIADMVNRHIAENQLNMTNCYIKSYTVEQTGNGTPIEFEYDSINGLTPVKAKSTEVLTHTVKRTDKLIVKDNKVLVSPIPQQGAPVIVVGADGKEMQQVVFYDSDGELTLDHTDYITGNGGVEYNLSFSNIDSSTLRVLVDKQEVAATATDGVLVLEEPTDGSIEASYRLKKSFYIDCNHSDDYAQLVLHDPVLFPDNSISVYYEVAKNTAYWTVPNINLNPLRTNVSNGFLYLSDQIEPAQQLDVYLSLNTLCANDYSRATVFIVVKDRYGNPVADEYVVVACSLGRLSSRVVKTNANGLATVAYQTRKGVIGVDTIVASTLKPGLEQKANIRLVPEGGNSRLSIVGAKEKAIYMLPDTDYWSTAIALEAKLIDEDFQYVSGAEVEFSTTWGKIQPDIKRITDTTGTAYCYVSAKLNEFDPSIPWAEPRPWVEPLAASRLFAVSARTNANGLPLEASIVLPVQELDIYKRGGE